MPHAVHILAAAAAPTTVLAGRWWFTRASRPIGQGASAARAPWRRTAPAPAGAGTGHERVLSLHTAFLDRYRTSIAPLYPRSGPSPGQG